MNEFAGDLFEFWDEKKEGRVLASDIVKDMLAIGLAPGKDFLAKMISIALRIPIKDFPKAFVTIKDF